MDNLKKLYLDYNQMEINLKRPKEIHKNTIIHGYKFL